MQKPLLIFDFFGVVVEEVAHKWLYDRITPTRAQEIIKTIFVAVDTGEITPAQCFDFLEQETGVKASQIEADWLEIGKLRIDTYNFIKENHDKYHIVLLSNAGTSFINKFFIRDKLDHLFIKKFISSELKMAKPDQQIFKYVLAHADVSFSYAVMIDDGKANIEAAKQVGLHGILFTNMEKAIAELEQIKLSEVI